jgi:hypothetical protein
MNAACNVPGVVGGKDVAEITIEAPLSQGNPTANRLQVIGSAHGPSIPTDPSKTQAANKNRQSQESDDYPQDWSV